MENNNQNTIRFLIELRSRLISSLIFLFLIFAFLLYYANHLYTWLAFPLLKFLPQGHLIATQIVSPFFAPFKLAFVTAIFLSFPFFIYQLWAFISPALYSNERRVLWPFILLSVFLFYAGLAFAYWIIFPLLFHFLASVVPQGVLLSPDMSEYLDFSSKLLLTFGFLFEIPMMMVLLIALGLTTRARFINMRSYAIVTAFIVGMLLAPPDVLSQTLLAVPIWLLYEAGIILSRLIR